MSTANQYNSAASLALPPDLPTEVMEFLREVKYLEPDRVRVGDRVAPQALTDLGTGKPVWIVGAHLTRPTALIFGSYT